MSPRPPSATLVADANILVRAVLGRAGLGPLLRVAELRTLITTAEVEREARRVLGDARFARPTPDPLADATFAIVPSRPSAYYASLLDDAGRVLTEAAASANGSAADAHVLALAWVADADIWSHDRDFGGTGWPSWSTRNLRRALGP